MMRKGAKLRHVERIEQRYPSVTWVLLDCHHRAVRSGHLSVGQRVFCTACKEGTDA